MAFTAAVRPAARLREFLPRRRAFGDVPGEGRSRKGTADGRDVLSANRDDEARRAEIPACVCRRATDGGATDLEEGARRWTTNGRNGSVDGVARRDLVGDPDPLRAGRSADG